MKKILVVIPTFNESENIKKLITNIFQLNISYLEVLVVDDNSTDGTIDIIEDLMKVYDKLNLLLRSGKKGIGSAHVEGILWAYKKKFDFCVTMDADFTHSPCYIPKLIDCLSRCDLVIASRHLKGSKMIGWSFPRKFSTFFNHFLVKLFFSIEFDTSNAFRAYNLNKIPKSIFDKLSSSSYSFFFESLVYFKVHGVLICEIPVVMRERVFGKSKLSFNDVFLHIKVFIGLLFKYYLRRDELRILVC